ncbi:MAG: helix-turn-helix domain-containing protein [Candidatus Uhrbacteria bacterium]
MSRNSYHDDELKKLKEALMALGATENAAAFYLACYRAGTSTVGDVAKVCKMDRSSAYLACDQLVELGLVETDASATRKTVTAKPPSAVLARLRTDMRRLRRHHDDVEESMQELLASYREQENKPTLRFFAGHDGLKQIVDDVLEHADGEILLFTNQRTEKNVFSQADHQEFVRERIRRGVSIRVLAADTVEAREMRDRDVTVRRETRIVEGEPFTSETYIYGDNVAMLSFDKDVVGFIVRSRDFARAQRWTFEQLWRIHEILPAA